MLFCQSPLCCLCDGGAQIRYYGPGGPGEGEGLQEGDVIASNHPQLAGGNVHRKCVMRDRTSRGGCDAGRMGGGMRICLAAAMPCNMHTALVTFCSPSTLAKGLFSESAWYAAPPMTTLTPHHTTLLMCLQVAPTCLISQSSPLSLMRARLCFSSHQEATMLTLVSVSIG